MDKLLQFLSLPFEVQWRACLVRLPWLVPRPILHLTSPDGPYPDLVYLPSRGKHFIPVYVFVPQHAPKTLSGFPAHLDFHGGGFIMGSCLEQAPWCAKIARETGRVVFSVDHRKGPLDKFPAAIEDAEDVLLAVLDSGRQTRAGKVLEEAVAKASSGKVEAGQTALLNPNQISLSGFSSGGNIALNLVLSIKKESKAWPSMFTEEGQVIPTLLFYPSFDSRQLPHERPRPPKMRPDSSSRFASIGSVLGPTYLPKEMREHPRASPGLNSMKDSLSRRARILLILPEVDTLASQSETWVDKMKTEGLNDVLTVRREEGMAHGWTQFPDLWLDEKALKCKYAVLQDAVEYLLSASDHRSAQ